MPDLTLLALRYDITPIIFINAVATEVGLIPPTSVPVVVREFRREVAT
jgi:translation initiation factor eIF-2B subunit delta